MRTMPTKESQRSFRGARGWMTPTRASIHRVATAYPRRDVFVRASKEGRKEGRVLPLSHHPGPFLASPATRDGADWCRAGRLAKPRDIVVVAVLEFRRSRLSRDALWSSAELTTWSPTSRRR